MTKNVVSVDFDGLERLQAAAVSVGQSEMDKLVKVVITELRSMAPYGVFDDVLTRHLWDEFCWCQQEGPYMHNLELVIKSCTSIALDKLQTHSLVCLSAYSEDELEVVEEEGEIAVGFICKDAIKRVAFQRIQEEAQAPKISIIGHGRLVELGFYLMKNGVVFSELSEDELMNALADHFEDVIFPDSDLSNVANLLAEAFIEQIGEESESFGLSASLAKFGADFKNLLIEQDILPDLQETRATLLEALEPPVSS